MMLNIVMPVYLAAGSVWSILCYPAVSPLGGEVLLAGTVALVAAGAMIGGVSMLLPELPCVPREKVRLCEPGGPFLGLMILLLGGALLAWEWERKGAGTGVYGGVCAMAMLGCCLMVAASRRCISAGAEGLRIRTAFGRVYDMRWTDVTGELAMKGSRRLCVGKKWFAVSGSTKDEQAFWRLCHERRMAAGVPRGELERRV